MAISNVYNTVGWTTIEQSKKLVAAGLDQNTADMHIIDWRTEKEGYFDTSLCYSKWDAEHVRGYLPCWSLGRLIGLIPDNYRISLDINYQRFSVSNEFSLSKRRDIHSSVCVFHTDNLNFIDSVVEAIIWLLENNNINKVKTNG